MLAKVQRQIELEHESVQEGVNRYRETLQENGEGEMPPGLKLIKEGMHPLIRSLKEFKLGGKGGAVNASVRKLLNGLQVSPEEVAYITLKHSFEWFMIPDLTIQACAEALAKKVTEHHEYNKFKTAMKNYVEMVEEDIKAQDASRKRTVMMALKRKKNIPDDVFSRKELQMLGQKLLDLMISSTGYGQLLLTRGGGYRLVPSVAVEEFLERHHKIFELLYPTHYPMLIPPTPWQDATVGGYLTLRLPLIRQAYTQKRREVIEVPERVLSVINSIQNVPWKINKRVLEVVDILWEEGSTLGGLPSKDKEPLPPTPWTSDEEFERMKVEQPMVVKQWKWDATKVYDRRAKMKSKIISIGSKLHVANKFKDEEEIYFPHVMDWRGRIYPVGSHVNPQSDDLGKSLLMFRDGKPLGNEGMFWLKVHGANLAGVDKVAFEDRVKWVEDHHEAILDSARNPLDGARFWADQDEPFQFLAFCFEYEGMVREGEDFVSHLSVSMDGTCSGLQHFSAMLRDEVGGKEVNLVPSDRPQDVYKKVAEVVSKKVEEDASLGDENAQIWLGKIDRGIAKRNVMTLPYGAKQHAFKDQLLNELEKRGEGYLDTEDTFKPAVYLAKKMWTGIGEVVIAAREAMEWLQTVSKVVTKLDRGITWTTPMGYQPVQHYIKRKEVRIKTFWGGMRVDLTLLEPTEKTDTVKNANGISPNFVHSLDASHLQLTVESCVAKGLKDFAFIHDSFGTHAANVSTLNETLREQFVAQYTPDVLERFRQEILAQIPEEHHNEIPPVPLKGRLDLDAVKQSRYFFA